MRAAALARRHLPRGPRAWGRWVRLETHRVQSLERLAQRCSLALQHTSGNARSAQPSSRDARTDDDEAKASRRRSAISSMCTSMARAVARTHDSSDEVSISTFCCRMDSLSA